MRWNRIALALSVAVALQGQLAEARGFGGFRIGRAGAIGGIGASGSRVRAVGGVGGFGGRVGGYGGRVNVGGRLGGVGGSNVARRGVGVGLYPGQGLVVGSNGVYMSVPTGAGRPAPTRNLPLRGDFNVNPGAPGAGVTVGRPGAGQLGGLQLITPSGRSLADLTESQPGAAVAKAPPAAPAPATFAADGGFVRSSAVAGGPGPQLGHQTTAVAAGALRGQGGTVREAFVRDHPRYQRWFDPTWIGRSKDVWRPRGWDQQAFWGHAAWQPLSDWLDWKSAPMYYDYGSTVVYEGDTVYHDSEAVATASQYYGQARQIAARGAGQAKIDGPWLSLGVWVVVQANEQDADKIIQLAVDKNGVVHGNYYDALTTQVVPLHGAVDPESQRLAFQVGDNRELVCQTGAYNLSSKDETQMLVHSEKGSTQQWTLVRIEPSNVQPGS